MKLDPIKLRKAFDASGLTPEKVAAAAGWAGTRRLYQIMAGRGSNINPLICKALAKKLKVHPADICKGD